MNFKKHLPYLAILAVGALLMSFLVYKHNADLTQLRASYITEKTQETEQVAQKVEHAFRAFYQGLRTMTQLPGVRNIDRYGQNFQGDSKLAVQQIYNNTYQNVTLSEVYLLPKSIDPEKIDPTTGKPEEPIITFDEFIVGGAANTANTDQPAEGDAAAEADKLEEVEIFEYRLMKTQLEYLSQNYPTNTTFEGLAVPAITGEPVVTCDNSEFTKADLLSGNDKPRTGILYTLPVYNGAGAFNGAVSGIVRLNVLEKLIPKGTHGISNIVNKYEGTVTPIPEFNKALEFFRKGRPDSSLIYSAVRKLDVVDTTEWNLWVALSDSDFYSLVSVKQANLIFYSGTVAVIFLVLGMLVAARTSQTYAASLEQKVNEKTLELSSRNEAMKLVFDHAKEGFLTCGLDGMIGQEYSQIVVEWFGHPKAGVHLAKFLFPKDAKKAAIFQMSWDQLVEDFMPFDVTADQMSTQFMHDDKWLSAAFTDIRDADNKLVRVMVVISDVTARVLGEKSASEQKEVMSVFQHLQVDRPGFIEFFADAETMVRALTTKSTSALGKAEEFRLIHTLKGNCGQYGLATLADLCHDLESALTDGTETLNGSQISALRDSWQDLTSRLIMLIGDNKNQKIELEESEYLAILKDIKAGASHKIIAASIERWKMMPVKKRLERMAEQAKSLGERLGLPEVEVTIATENLRIHPEQFKNVWSAMIHVIRNSVDHGLKDISGRTPTLTLVASSSAKNELLISVRDNGKGINWERVKVKAKSMGLKCDSREDLEACLFADGLSTNDSVSSVSGRGVGMAAVREAVSAVGGTITIRSEINKGTEFLFTLPLTTNQETFKSPVAAPTAAKPILMMANHSVSIKNKKVLVVDDEPEIVHLFKEMLEAFGCIVLEATNVRDGLRLIHETRDLDVIITDSRMGEERGLELISKVLSDPSLCQNLIMCSAYLESMNFGNAVLPLSKPFSEETLMNAVQTVLAQRDKKSA